MVLFCKTISTKYDVSARTQRLDYSEFSDKDFGEIIINQSDFIELIYLIKDAAKYSTSGKYIIFRSCFFSFQRFVCYRFIFTFYKRST